MERQQSIMVEIHVDHLQKVSEQIGRTMAGIGHLLRPGKGCALVVHMPEVKHVVFIGRRLSAEDDAGPPLMMGVGSYLNGGKFEEPTMEVRQFFADAMLDKWTPVSDIDIRWSDAGLGDLFFYAGYPLPVGE